MIDAFTHTFCSASYLKSLRNASDEVLRHVAAAMTELASSQPNFLRLERRLADMKKYGVDHQVATIHSLLDPSIYRLKRDEELAFCRCLNDGMSSLAQQSGGRIYALGAVPFGSLEGEGVEEMKRAVNELGLKGFMAMSNIRGKPLDSFGKFWDTLNHLGVSVHIHPADPVNSDGRPYENDFDLTHILGWPLETGLALSRLILSGIADAYPYLRIVSHHMGGIIPFFAERIDDSSFVQAWLAKGAKEPRKLLPYFRRFYYDTAVGSSQAAFKCGVEVFGPDRLVFSTDYPFGPEEGRTYLESYPKILRELGLSRREEEEILDENIRRVLKL